MERDLSAVHAVVTRGLVHEADDAPSYAQCRLTLSCFTLVSGAAEGVVCKTDKILWKARRR